MEQVQREDIPKNGVYTNDNCALFEALKPVYIYCDICGGNKQEGEHGLGVCGRYAA